MIHYLPYIYLIGAAQGLLLALALWHKKVNISSNKLLSVWLLFLCCDLILKSVYLNDQQTPLLMLYRVIQFFPFLYGSFFFLYSRCLVNKSAFDLKDMIHFLAFVLYLGINLPAIILNQPELLVGMRYFDVFLYAYSVSYVIAGLMIIVRYSQNLQQQQVDTHDINLNWLKVMGYSQIVIWLIAVSQWLLPIKGYNLWTIYIAVAVWMILIGYLSLLQDSIPQVVPIKKTVDVHEDDRFDEVKVKLDHLINHEKLHLQPSLTIAALAKASGYPEYLISLFINRKHGINFHDFINQLRINEAQKMLKQADEQRTILQIAFDCGYNSKSTFNVAFKRFTSMTPSQFRQQQQSS